MFAEFRGGGTPVQTHSKYARERNKQTQSTKNETLLAG